MVTVSVIAPLFRPGGLDLLYAGLQAQTVPKSEWEMILVDHRYERRHRQIMDLAEQTGVRTLHVPEHRRNGPFAVLAAAWNTGLALAQGDIVIFMPDFAYVEPDWIAKHRAWHVHDDSRYVLAPYTLLELPTVYDRFGVRVPVPPPHEAATLPPHVVAPPDDTFDEIHLFGEPFDPDWILTCREWPQNLQCPRYSLEHHVHEIPLHWHIHMRNESCPRQALLDLNGFDEQLDRGKAMIDIECGRRVELSGRKVVHDAGNHCWILNPRTLFPTMPQGAEVPGRWDYPTCEKYALGTTALAAPNRYPLWALSERLSGWREAAAIDTSTLEVRDEDYYGSA